MKLTPSFNPYVRNAEIPKEMRLEDAEGNVLVFKVLGFLSTAFRKANDAKHKDDAARGMAMFKALVAEVPEGLELEDGTPVTAKNLDKLAEEAPWLIGQVIEFAKGHSEFDPKP
jgi:hypothetical protein